MQRSFLRNEVIFDKYGHFSTQYANFFIRVSSYIMVNRLIKTCIFYSHLRVSFCAKRDASYYAQNGCAVVAIIRYVYILYNINSLVSYNYYF